MERIEVDSIEEDSVEEDFGLVPPPLSENQTGDTPQTNGTDAQTAFAKQKEQDEKCAPPDEFDSSMEEPIENPESLFFEPPVTQLSVDLERSFFPDSDYQEHPENPPMDVPISAALKPTFFMRFRNWIGRLFG